MNIDIKLDKDFATHIQYLARRYGTKITTLNGLEDEQINYTSFIDNFIDKQNVADASIDGNANVGHKDIVSLEHEMSKPHAKLLAFNKIYYEIKKKYGFKAANKWLEEEWVGAFYMHDAPSTTFRPYCIQGTECCSFIYNGKFLNASLEDIYNLVDGEEQEDNGVKFKRPVNLKVLDMDRDTLEKRYVTVKMISKKNTDKDLYFTKVYNGSNLITTEDHKFIGTEKDIPAKDLEEEETELLSAFDDTPFTNSINSIDGLELTEDLGYILGMYLAEGYEDHGQLIICQDSKKSEKIYNNIKEKLNLLGVEYSEIDKHKLGYPNIFRLRNGTTNFEKKLKKLYSGKRCTKKRLSVDYTHFNEEFLKGILAGIIDGDGTIKGNNMVMIRMTSRTLINQIREIGLHFGVFFGSRIPYIQTTEAKIRQKSAMYSANVNMNRNKEFFQSLPSVKIASEYTMFEYNEKFANKNYICEFGKTYVRDSVKTYKPDSTVYDLSTASHTFICNEILVHNCYAYDLKRLVDEGLFFIPNFNNKAPEHLTTFIDFVGEFVSWNCNRTSGRHTCPYSAKSVNPKL